MSSDLLLSRHKFACNWTCIASYYRHFFVFSCYLHLDEFLVLNKHHTVDLNIRELPLGRVSGVEQTPHRRLEHQGTALGWVFGVEQTPHRRLAHQESRVTPLHCPHSQRHGGDSGCFHKFRNCELLLLIMLDHGLSSMCRRLLFWL